MTLAETNERFTEELSAMVLERLTSKLESWGNVIAPAHREALYEIAHAFALDVNSKAPSRWAIGLDTGLGKTTLLITFLNTLKELDIQYPVLVCVPNLKAMKEFRDGLLESHTVEEVGCKFSASSDLSEADIDFQPARDCELNNYKILITCHARVDNTKGDWERLLEIDGRKRAVYYDEALKRGQVHAGKVRVLKDDFNLLKDFLNEHMQIDIEETITKLENAVADEVIPLPFDAETWIDVRSAIKKYNKDTNRSFEFEGIVPVVSGNYDSLRHGNGDFFTYENTLPEMQSLFVLDANHPFSVLSQLDESIQQLRLEKFKHFDNVTFKAYGHNLGRRAVMKDPKGYIQWAADLVREVKEEGKNPVVICFKEMKGEVERIISVPVITWGMHAGSNKYSEKDALICIGLLRLSDEVTKGQITLHRDDIAGSVEGFQQIAGDEALLNLYQAVSRGRSRKVDFADGRTLALPSTIYLSGPLNRHQEDLLRNVMPGCKYLAAKFDLVIADIKHYFDGISFQDMFDPSISLKQLSKDVESYRSLSRWDKDAVISELISEGWFRRGRTLSQSLRYNLGGRIV